MVPLPTDEKNRTGCKLQLHAIIHCLKFDDAGMIPSQVRGLRDNLL